jgi:hypothetical protein
MIKCEIDGKEFKNGGVFAKYLKKQYGLTYQKYYHQYILKSDEIPKCKCGCGEELEWKRTGYGKYKGRHGLILRLVTNNPWGRNKDAQIKSAETRRKQYASGERHGWCYGLSKETDDRVRNLVDKTKNTILNNKNELKRRSEFMKKQWRDGTIHTLYRENSSQWKGGVSSIQNVARNDKRLYEQWKYPILIRDQFKCVDCGSGRDLHVHHNCETFSDIIKKVMTLDDYEKVEDYDTKKRVTDKIVEYHVKNNVSGITLCKECHNKLHPSLNFY